MNKESILYGVIGLLAGVVLAGFGASYAVNNNNMGMMRMMGMGTDRSMSMDYMMESLEDKTGDSFDQEYITQMIMHHEGAIEMAKLAKDNAKHDELKTMADEIISAQSKEIDMMQTWRSDWGYKDVPQSHMMGR